MGAACGNLASRLAAVHSLNQFMLRLGEQPILFIFIMVAIRLNRQGSKDRPYYKIVVVDSRARRDGDFIEQVGTYNPMAEGENYTLDLEKVEKWISNGAQPSETVASMIKKARAAKA